ncbi:MAG: hypothetical protein OEZ34_04905 [Spirochaetia bacterium]|nr:hypothetical protein [Spirochaetia bacterium]
MKTTVIFLFLPAILFHISCRKDTDLKKYVALHDGINVGCISENSYCRSYQPEGHRDCFHFMPEARNSHAAVKQLNDSIECSFSAIKSGCIFQCIQGKIFCKSYGKAECSDQVDQDMIRKFAIYN